MFHLRNDTPFASELFVFPDLQGFDTLCVAVKATFDLSPGIRVAGLQEPVFLEDTYRGEPGRSSLQYASEAHPEKPGTDVVVIGEACAPLDRPVAELFVTVSVAGRSSTLKVFGDRHWKKTLAGFSPGAPAPFVRMPIVYERAYGGTHVIDGASGTAAADARNPVGIGFTVGTGSRGPADTRLPNIEDPRSLIRTPKDRPRPAGYGYIAPSWEPRLSWAGSCGETWRKTRAPFLPEDFDPRFYHAAHPDLVFPDHLRGGEPVALTNLTPGRERKFNLPACEPRIEVGIAGRFVTAKARLETVLLEPARERLCLVWKSSTGCGKRIAGADVRISCPEWG
ncbi:MAG: DUF2169 domain-containing protein [Syntrophaceae bacterium]|nr:DUF2169 domain-containing protein [Syntrophaceae bacterium]